MLLKQWMQEQGIAKHTYQKPDCFTFGEAGYAIVVLTGATHFDNDLERILTVMRDEILDAFERGYGANVKYGHPMKSRRMLVRRDCMDLIVEIAPRAVAEITTISQVLGLVDRVRSEITTFNIAGRWPNPFKDNL